MSRANPREGLSIYEFFGIPGVGKSYLARTAVPRDIERPMERYSQGGRTQRVSRKALLLLRHLPAAFSTVSWAKEFVALYPQPTWSRRCKVIFNWLFIDALIRDVARGVDGIIVLDQGVAQAVWSTCFSATRKPSNDEALPLVQRFLERLPIGQWTVVHVTASESVIKSRLEQRSGDSPVDRDLANLDEAYVADRESRRVMEAFAKQPQIELSAWWVTVVNEDESSVLSLDDIIRKSLNRGQPLRA